MNGSGKLGDASVRRISAAAMAAPSGRPGGVILKFAIRGPVVPFGAGGMSCCVKVLASSWRVYSVFPARNVRWYSSLSEPRSQRTSRYDVAWATSSGLVNLALNLEDSGSPIFYQAPNFVRTLQRISVPRGSCRTPQQDAHKVRNEHLMAELVRHVRV